MKHPLPWPLLLAEGEGWPKAGVGVFVLALVVRLPFLSADAPAWLSWSSGTATDEGFYTLDARHFALFGTPAPGNFHDRLLSPLLSVLQQGVFSTFGIGLIQARLISVTFGLLTVAALFFAVHRAFDARAAVFAALFLGLAPPFVFYNRLALQETPTVFFLTLAFWFWTRGGKWIGLAGAAAGIALTVKSLAIVGSFGAARNRSAWIGLTIVIILYGAIWYAPHREELVRMASYYRSHQLAPHGVQSVGLNVKRAFFGDSSGWERGVFPYLLATLPVPCLLAFGRKKWDAATAYLTLWLTLGLAAMTLLSYAPSRYFIVFLPPLCALAAVSASRLTPKSQIAVVGLFLLTSGFWMVKSFQNLTFDARDAGRQLTKLLPPGSVMVGDFAPALCLDTPFQAAPVQPGLSNDVRPVETLGATHIAVTRAPIWQNWWRARYPNLIVPSNHVATFSLGGARRYIVDIYRTGTP